MKKHVFSNQGQGICYFLTLIIGAANIGSAHESVKAAFLASIKDPDDYDRWATGLWQEIVFPILSFYNAVMAGGDDSMRCDFKADVTPSDDHKGPIRGTLTWRGQWTSKRSVSITFDAQGGAVMTYHLGLEPNGTPKESSSFLGLPMEGDEEIEVAA